MTLFPPHVSRAPRRAAGRFPELHLYTGSRCNRACAFCTVGGEPGGWYQALAPPVLDAALRLVVADGNLKVYGGEPTLDLEGLLAAFRYLRARAFTGWLTVFSNGVLASRLLALLDADGRCEAVLNYSILHGKGAEPLPAASRRLLEQYAARHPGRIFAGHADLVPAGRGGTGPESGRPQFDGRCPRCRPVLTTRGRLHACPFAVEHDSPHYDLGGTDARAGEALARHAAFLDWIDAVLEPAARTAGAHPCAACTAWDGPAWARAGEGGALRGI